MQVGPITETEDGSSVMSAEVCIFTVPYSILCRSGVIASKNVFFAGLEQLSTIKDT